MGILVYETKTISFDKSASGGFNIVRALSKFEFSDQEQASYLNSMLVKAKVNESAWIFCAKTKKSEISLIKFNSTVYKIEKEMIAPNQYASPVSLFCLKTNPNSIAVCYTVNEGKTELVILSVKDLKIHH